MAERMRPAYSTIASCTASRVIFFLVSSISFVGCGTSTLYVQSLDVRAPLHQPPLFTTPDSTTFEARVVTHYSQTGGPWRLPGRISNHTNVNARGIYEIDSVLNVGGYTYIERAGVNSHRYRGSNFTWSLPRSSLSLHLDMPISNNASLVLGLRNNGVHWEQYTPPYGRSGRLLLLDIFLIIDVFWCGTPARTFLHTPHLALLGFLSL